MKRKLAWLLTFAMVVSLAAGCSAEPEETIRNTAENKIPEAAEASFYMPGTYQGTAPGNCGDITVAVTVSEDQIEEITILEEDETYYQFILPKTEIPARIIENQSLAVDTIAGATISSNGIIRAVEAALAQAAEDLSPLYEIQPKEKGETQILDCQVLVVGAGYSGMTAANRLKEQGIDVLLIEQLDYVGGNGRMSTGGFMLGDTDEHVQLIKDYVSTRYYFDDFPVAEGTPNVERIMNNIEATQDAYEMFCKIGVRLLPRNPDINAYIADIPNGLVEASATEGNINTFGSWGAESLKEAYEKQGGRLMLHTKATSLLTDENNTVIGAVAEGTDCDYEIHADAVILATGSYSHNNELLSQYIPWRTDDLSCTCAGDDGSGILMAMDVGAVMTEDNYVNGGARVAYPATALKTTDGNWNSSDIISSVAMIVGLNGKRLASEKDDRYFRYYPVMDGLDQFFCIYDSAQLGSVGMLETYDELASTNGPYYKADTLEELAEICRMDTDTLLESVKTFNYYCETGKDVFDASLIDENSFSQDTHAGASGAVDSALDTKLPIAEGPFYATRITFVGFDLVGGIKTGAQGQVLDVNGNPVKGLYGIGFISSRDFFGSGTAHGYCLMIAISTGMVTADYLADELTAD